LMKTKSIEIQEKILPDNRKIKEQAELFAALADPTRLKLLQVLCLQNPPGCRCVNNLSHLLGITQPAVSQHLRVLKSVGLVIGERRGFRIHYLIDPEGLKRCQRILANTFIFGENCKENSCKQNCHSVTATT
jgi:DNA-binding transcriptional ArsR family regulator